MYHATLIQHRCWVKIIKCIYDWLNPWSSWGFLKSVLQIAGWWGKQGIFHRHSGSSVMKLFSEDAKAANLLYMFLSCALSSQDGISAHRPKLHSCLSTACQLWKKLCSLLTITAPIIIMSLWIFVHCWSNHISGENDYKANLVTNLACWKVLDWLFS